MKMRRIKDDGVALDLKQEIEYTPSRCSLRQRDLFGSFLASDFLFCEHRELKEGMSRAEMGQEETRKEELKKKETIQIKLNFYLVC